MAKRKIQELTTGVHDFESLIKDKTKKYVDKTNLLYELASEKTDAQYFISRPRRFGKSLMLSTLQAMCEGRRDLFKGLEIYDLPWEGWTEPTPVYSFSMSKVNALTFEKLEAALANDGSFRRQALRDASGVHRRVDRWRIAGKRRRAWKAARLGLRVSKKRDFEVVQRLPLFARFHRPRGEPGLARQTLFPRGKKRNIDIPAIEPQ